ncbi:MAG TPA: aminotransferase class I/II-fold pyridoxal phosphate-dependent enzyme [Candidatus Paceibacterota bacterium]|nr:aminotransferase class I/II-fold pyridoxal phosphate-dependent enzyme [Candidatus Paceibacterota bacterium]
MTSLEVRAPSLEELRTHRSEKWREYPRDVLPLPVAEMDFPIAAPIRDLLLDMVSHSDLGYLGPIPELPISFVKFAQKRWDWSADVDQFHLATDVGVAVVEVLRLITTPGDTVVVNSPVYHNFYTWIDETHLEKIDVPFVERESGWFIDFESLESAYKKGAKVHLLCNPQNPLGRVFTKEELRRIAKLAHEYSVVVISDEIHAPLTYSEATFVPFLSLGFEAESVGIVVTAASKAWNIAGLKCALTISQSEAMDSVLKGLPKATHYRASLLGGFAAAAAYEEGNEWLDGVIATLDSNRHYLAELLSVKIPQIKYRIPQNSYLAWLDLSDLNLGVNPSSVLLERGKVALNSGGSFGPHTSQFVRLNFATSHSILEEAVERMVVAIS